MAPVGGFACWSFSAILVEVSARVAGLTLWGAAPLSSIRQSCLSFARSLSGLYALAT
jgi:hypothetical protein